MDIFKIFKYKINQREYAYLSFLLIICHSFLYFYCGHVIIPSQLLWDKIIYLIILVVCILLYIYFALLRINDTKISRWFLLLILIELIFPNFIKIRDFRVLCSLLLTLLPSCNKTDNKHLYRHLLFTTPIPIAILIFIGLCGIKGDIHLEYPSHAYICVFLILIFGILLIVFIADLIITNLLKLYRKHKQNHTNQNIEEKT